MPIEAWGLLLLVNFCTCLGTNVLSLLLLVLLCAPSSLLILPQLPQGQGRVCVVPYSVDPTSSSTCVLGVEAPVIIA